MKTQLEIPGAEREVIADLERTIERLLKTKRVRAKLLERERAINGEIQGLLAEHAREGYWYIDGEHRWYVAAEQVTRTRVREVKPKRQPDEQPEPLL